MIAAEHSCPGATELATFFDGGAMQPNAEQIRSHLDDCGDCLSSLFALVSQSQLGGGVELAAGCADVDEGTVVGPFEIRKLLGAGNLGRVYSALDRRLGRTVALKVLGIRRDHETWSEQLVAEAQAMARIRHPNVCTVHEVGRDGELVYIAMERIEGDTLGGGGLNGLSHPAVVGVLVDAARALQAAHDQDVIHRDFKPDNVMIEDRHGKRRVVVCDFGLAAAGWSATSEFTPTDSAETTSGLVGSPAYMAPEQLDGEQVTTAADVWAFGVTAWELLSGQRPFRTTTLSALREEQNSVPNWPSGTKLAPAVRRVLAQCLNSKPSARPTMAQVANQLDRTLVGRARRHRAVTAAVVSVGVILAVAAWWKFGVNAKTDAGLGDCEALEHNGWPIDREQWLTQARASQMPAWLTERVLESLDVRARGQRDQFATMCRTHKDDHVYVSLWSQCRGSMDESAASYLETLLTWPTSDFERVPTAMAALRSISFCDTEEGLRNSVAPSQGSEFTIGSAAASMLRANIARAHLFVDAAHDGERVDTLLRNSIVLAEWAGNPRLVADLALTTATLRPEGSTEARDRQWRDVVAEAEMSGNAWVGARAWLALADLWSSTEPKDHRASAALEQSNWAIKRLGDPPRLRSEWHRSRAGHAWRTGDYQGASSGFTASIQVAGDDPLSQRHAILALAKLAVISEDHARARALYESVLDDERSQTIPKSALATLHSAYAEVLYQMDEIDRGLEANAMSLRLGQEALGNNDPELGKYTLIRGMLELENGDIEACLASIDEALELYKPYGNRHSSIGAALNLRSAAEAQTGDHRAALISARKAATLYTELYGANHESSIFASMQVAENLSATDQLGESRRVFEETLVRARETMGESHSLIPSLQSSLAGVLDRSGEEQQAVAMGEAALAAIRTSQSPAPYVGQAEHQLADILSDSNPKRALELARAARKKYGDAAYWAKERKQVERLIERLRGQN